MKVSHHKSVSRINFAVADYWTGFAEMENLASHGLAFPRTTESAHHNTTSGGYGIIVILQYLYKVDG